MYWVNYNIHVFVFSVFLSDRCYIARESPLAHRTQRNNYFESMKKYLDWFPVCKTTQMKQEKTCDTLFIAETD